MLLNTFKYKQQIANNNKEMISKTMTAAIKLDLLHIPKKTYWKELRKECSSCYQNTQNLVHQNMF